jgi:hypothetical protein
MSSKRKNTPTKLAKDDMYAHSNLSDEDRDSDSPIESDPEADLNTCLNLNLHMMNNTTDLADEHELSEADSLASDKPKSKKQRILQSVMNGNESDN